MSRTRYLDRLIRRVLREDVGPGDLTTELTVSAEGRCRARMMAKSEGMLSGMVPFQRVFELLSADITAWDGLEDGTAFKSGDCVAAFEGLTRPILTGERSAMNFVQHLSGVATLTAAYVKAVEGLPVRICDTRKTTPGLRELEKEAVRHGGGRNHRDGLHDGILIKDNHIEAAGGVAAALQKARAGSHHLRKIEIEVRNLEEFDEAMAAGADVIMLDNMPLEDMREAVRRRGTERVLLEASGNVTLDTVRGVAETGVNIVSAGALTHSARAADLSLLVEHV